MVTCACFIRIGGREAATFCALATLQDQLEQAEQYYCKAIEADPSKESPFMRLG